MSGVPILRCVLFIIYFILKYFIGTFQFSELFLLDMMLEFLWKETSVPLLEVFTVKLPDNLTQCGASECVIKRIGKHNTVVSISSFPKISFWKI